MVAPQPYIVMDKSSINDAKEQTSEQCIYVPQEHF